ncbi:MAG: NAD(P)H-binding protein [Cyanobacteria bacterium RI_101]|nr:NAD(P)H-binding protein [Cyanobacteria bacterium RI_101]
MRLLVVGGTGTLGRQIARRALEQGHSVRCLARNPRKGAFLKEWGAEVIQGNLCRPETLPPALADIDAVVDAATARATDSLSIRQVDWQGKVNLIQAAKTAGVERYLFFSILGAEDYPQVPLMEIKSCTEKYLTQVDLNYTIFQLAGFMQGLIGQYAIPILENQSVWMTGESSPTAYMDTQDIAKLALRALEVPATERRTLPLVGPKAWTAAEIIALCERLSGRQARISKVPLGVLRGMRGLTRCFQWTYNISDRLAFAEVLASGKPLTADMSEVYPILGLDPQDVASLESYLQEYFGRILKKLKELDYEQENSQGSKSKKKGLFF